MTSIAEMSGARKSAILLLALDEDSAAEVFKFLSANLSAAVLASVLLFSLDKTSRIKF